MRHHLAILSSILTLYGIAVVPRSTFVTIAFFHYITTVIFTFTATTAGREVAVESVYLGTIATIALKSPLVVWSNHIAQAILDSTMG